MGESKYIFIGMTSGFGPLAQIIPIANELKKHGYEAVCFIERSAKTMLQDMGFGLLEFPYIPMPEEIYPSGAEWWNLDYFWGKYGYLDYEYVKQLIEEYIKGIEKYKPELIISVFHPPAAIAAKKLGIPLVCVTQACMHKNGKGGRTTWWKELPDIPKKASTAVNRVLEELGLKTIERMEDLSEGDITIVPSIPEFDVIDNENILYTGPMLWEGPEQNEDNEYILQRKNKFLIYAYTGYLGRALGKGKASGLTLLKNIVGAFNNTEFDVIISIGVGEKVPQEIELADNITIDEWVPVSQIIPYCDLTIHHGGHGSCLQGITRGVPSIVIPTSDEREYNARQLLELGLGEFILPDEITPNLLLDTARAIVNNTELKHRNKMWSDKINNRNYNGAVEAAKAIMELIEDK